MNFFVDLPFAVQSAYVTLVASVSIPKHLISMINKIIDRERWNVTYLIRQDIIENNFLLEGMILYIAIYYVAGLFLYDSILL